MHSMNNYRLIFFVLMVLSLGACNKDAEVLSVQEDEIQLTSEIAPSRVTS